MFLYSPYKIKNKFSVIQMTESTLLLLIKWSTQNSPSLTSISVVMFLAQAGNVIAAQHDQDLQPR